MFWPCSGKCSNYVIIVIELFDTYKEYYSSLLVHYFTSKNVLHTPVILLTRITIGSGHRIKKNNLATILKQFVTGTQSES